MEELKLVLKKIDEAKHALKEGYLDVAYSRTFLAYDLFIRGLIKNLLKARPPRRHLHLVDHCKRIEKVFREFKGISQIFEDLYDKRIFADYGEMRKKIFRDYSRGDVENKLKVLLKMVDAYTRIVKG